MNKRQRKKQTYKKYIREIFAGYEKMIADKTIQELQFSYLKETTFLTRDNEGVIHFLTKEK